MPKSQSHGTRNRETKKNRTTDRGIRWYSEDTTRVTRLGLPKGQDQIICKYVSLTLRRLQMQIHPINVGFAVSFVFCGS